MRSIQTLFRFIIVGGIIAAIFVFVSQNYQSISVKFMTWTSHSFPLALVLFMAFIGGFLLAGFYFLMDVLRMQSTVRKTKKQVALLEKEIEVLRNQPLYEDSPQNSIPSSSLLEQHLTHEGQPEESLYSSEKRKWM